MKKVKITILKTTLQEDLAKEYGVEGLSTCPLMNYQYVFALAHGASDIWYYEDWIKTPGVAIVSCNDGLRPVIMKLEATDIESKPE
ncbi:TIGR04076 family protein [uncultured Methanobrevibacter sp.]|uniref:TIGR04076 family protein n=1 Tax=uncultured Methanobrevibacter sp. TaxID=253161 RepID=UPI0025CB7C31|nr:TIGR04076 family protein [uncultured Methanobrevibacter sp.]